MGVFVSCFSCMRMTSQISSAVGVKVSRHCGVTPMGEPSSCSEMQPMQRALQTCEDGSGAS